MRVARYTAYGGPETVVIDEARVPTPKPGEVLVRVHAAPVTAGDARMRSGKVPRGMGLILRAVIGLRRPRNPPGWAFSGRVAGLGDGVTSFKPGDRVFGLLGFPGGAHRDYLVIKADGLILLLPSGLSHAEGAAFFFGGLTAAQAVIEEAKTGSGTRLLVVGATGSVGSAAVEIARHLGAKVTALASPANHALARDLGAAHVADYRGPLPQGPFDAVIDVMGALGWSAARPLLAPGGRLVMITATLAQMIGANIRPRRSRRRIIATMAREDKPAMLRLLALHQAGGYRPRLGPILPFDQLAQAHAIAESFHKPGNLVVVMAEPAMSEEHAT